MSASIRPFEGLAKAIYHGAVNSSEDIEGIIESHFPDSGDDSLSNVRRLRATIRYYESALKHIGAADWATSGELRGMARTTFSRLELDRLLSQAAESFDRQAEAEHGRNMMDANGHQVP